MFSPIKVALFAFISFATLAIAIPAPEPRRADAKALITGTNVLLRKAMLPIAHVNSANATSEYVTPVLDQVVEIVVDLVDALKGSGLSGCGCTSQDILELVSTTLQIILGTLGPACGSNSGLLPLIGGLVSVVVELLQVVLGLVGGLVTELLVLLINNGCAGVVLGLRLDPLIDCLGLGSLLQGLLGSLL
ncbi:hypothetical protein EDB84DRAFT_1435231 [Lactarius hengduanensis]|nr:hypothetical protein EDB84DRAFT_1435231 [Lactarius hengduanensis]